MRTTILTLAIAAVAAAATFPKNHTPDDKEFQLKQKSIMELFVRVHQPNMYMDLKNIGDHYDIAGNIDHYTNTKAVKEFLTWWKMGMLPRGETFSVLYDPHMEQAIKLFDVFYYAKDWDTFFKTACWARDRVNEGQFVYSMMVAIMHRPDTQDVVMPPIYEIMPHFFMDAHTIQKAYEVRMEGFGMSEGRDTVVIPVNHTSMWGTWNREQQLRYFTEDVGLNTYYTYFHLMYPFWFTAKNYGLELDRYGELFYYTQQQMLARYNTMRMSFGMPEVDMILFDKPMKTGYSSMLRYQNGLEVPSRPDNMMFMDEDMMRVQDIMDIEARLREAIDQGYVWAQDGSKVSIYEFRGIDILGNLIESMGQSVNYRYYHTLYHMLKVLVSRMVDPVHKHGVAPGTLENFMTTMRDPIYFHMCKRIDVIFQKYKMMLGSYAHDELFFAGLKIESVDVDKMVTYFDTFDMDLMNAINVNNIDEAQKMHIIARQPRLTYKPFTYKVMVNSDKETNAMVRVFMGPKYDFTGQEMDMDQMRKFMVEFDRFPFKIVSGKNVITRNSHDSSVIARDHTTYQTLMKQIESGMDFAAHTYKTMGHCGFPEHLMLPMGKKNGMPMMFFVMVTPYDGPMTEMPPAWVSCGVGYNMKYPDNKPMGYPFDRMIRDFDFTTTPNMYFKDVMIFHKKTGDLSL